MAASCDDCTYNIYDEEMDAYFCEADIDMDDMERLFSDPRCRSRCPYFRNNDEYEIVRHQN